MQSLNIKLEKFEGPFDLLFHLIEKNKIDIYDIPIKMLTEQYLEFIDDIHNKNMENMSEFLVMAASLLEIKSKMLISSKKDENEEEDPRDELVNKLIEYKKFKNAANIFNEKQNIVHTNIFKQPDYKIINTIKQKRPVSINEILGDVTLELLYNAFEDVLKRREVKTDKIRSSFNSVTRDLYTVEQKIQYILDLIVIKEKFKFSDIFENDTSKAEVVVTFLAMLELIKIKKIYVIQNSIFDEIFISAY